MAPLCSWSAIVRNASRHSVSRNVWVSSPVRSMRPSRDQVEVVRDAVLTDAVDLLDAEGVGADRR